MKKTVFIYLSVVVVAFTTSSCDKWCPVPGGGDLGGREMSPVFITVPETVPTPTGKGTVVVYFNPLCLYDNEKISIFIDGEHYGDITLPITKRAEQIVFGETQTVSALLDVGTHTLSAKLGRHDLGNTSFPIRQNYCYKLCLELPCP